MKQDGEKVTITASDGRFDAGDPSMAMTHHGRAMSRVGTVAALALLGLRAAGPLAASEVQVAPDSYAPGVVVPWDQFKEEEVRKDPLGQWASDATASTQYRPEDYNAKQATGAPDVPTYSDNKRAWTPNAAERQREWLKLSFEKAVHATEVRVRQTFNPGTIVKIEAFEPDGSRHYLWKGRDPNSYPNNQIAWFVVRFPKTSFAIQQVMLTLDTPSARGWKQIDAVQLVGGQDQAKAADDRMGQAEPSEKKSAAEVAVAAPSSGSAAGSAAQTTPANALPPHSDKGVFYNGGRNSELPQATTKLRNARLDIKPASGDESVPIKIARSTRVLIDNPYLDLSDRFFNVPRQMACLPDGSLAVFSTAKLIPDGYMKGNPYAYGVWRMAPDGAITPIAAHSELERLYKPARCGDAAVSSTIAGLTDVGAVSPVPDGSLLFPHRGWGDSRNPLILRLTSKSQIEPVPNDADWCLPRPDDAQFKLFKNIGSVAQDPVGNVWALDYGACALYRINPDGSVWTVLKPAQVCPKGEPERYIRAEHMLWDTVHGELVTAGNLLWLQSPKADNYSTVWRIKPDGTFKRVYLAGKVRRDLPSVDGIGGLALDVKGDIYFGAGFLSSGYGIVKLVDESKGRTEVVAGAPRPSDIEHADGPAKRAYFGTIQNLCFAPDRSLYIHDANHLIRKMTPNGEVTTWGF